MTDQKPGILLADDEVTFRETFAKVLEEEGFSVTAVSDGREAVDAVTRQSFAVAILDIQMPGSDGISVLREAVAIRPQMRVIIDAFDSVGGGNTLSTEFLVNAVRDDLEGDGTASPALEATGFSSYLALPSNQPVFGGTVGDRIVASLTLVDQDLPYVGEGSVTVDGVELGSLPAALLP